MLILSLPEEVLKTNAFDFPLMKSLEYVATFPVSMLERCQINEGRMKDGTEVIFKPIFK